jgi:hypothetical protein
LVIDSITPPDGAVAAERDGIVVITFSADLLASSVTPSRVKVSGPGGPVQGQLQVEGTSITFTPSAPFALLADYTVEVAAGVASPNAGELAADESFGFQTRDGVFGKPVRLSSGSVLNLGVSGNRAGDVVVHWADGAAPQSALAASFDPMAKSWGKAAALEADHINDHSFSSVCLNSAGEAFAVTGSVVASWNRASAGIWGTASTAGIAQPRSCALADDGTAMTIWEGMVGSESRVFAASLSSQNKWSATTTLQPKARTWGLVRYGAGFLAFQARQPSSQVFAQVFEPQSGWLEAKAVTPPGTGANYVSWASWESTAVFGWNDPKGRMQVSSFDGESWVTQELGPASGGTRCSAGRTGYVATWLNQGDAYAASYDSAKGWADPVKLGTTSAEDYGPGASIDDAGNAMTAWPEGSSISWRRGPHGSTEWPSVQQLENQDPRDVVLTAAATGEVAMVWTNPLGVWASSFE